MRYLKILLIGIVFSLFIDVVGLAIGALKCLADGLPIKGSVFLSLALGVGAKEGAFGGLAVIVLMLIGMPRSRPPN